MSIASDLMSRYLPKSSTSSMSVAKPPVSKEDPKLLAARRKAALEAERKKKISQEFLAKQQAMGAGKWAGKGNDPIENFARGVQQAAVKLPVSMGQSVIKSGSELIKRPVDTTITPKSKMAKAILGEEIIKPMDVQIKESQKKAIDVAETIQPGLKGRKDFSASAGRAPVALAGALMFGGLKAADVDPTIGGGAKKVAGKVAKEVAEQVAKRGAKEAAEQVAKKYKSGIVKPPEPVKTPQQKVMDALDEATPIRAEQEALYTKARKERIAKVGEVGKAVPGEAGYHAQLSTLKGEMPKVKYESIRNKLTQSDVDSLFDTVEKSNISQFEKISAKNGLAKILGAEGVQVPTRGEIALLSELFSPEFVAKAMDNKTTMQKLWENAAEVLNLPRAMMATADLSAPLRQGVFMIGKPKQFASAFGNMFKYAFSDKAYQGLKTSIEARETYPLMRESKLALTDIGGQLCQREETFMSNLAEKIPIFGRVARGSNRAYSGFLNKLRADTFDDLVKKSIELGVAKERPDSVMDIAKFINAATGRGNLGVKMEGAAPLLNAIFFSPRLMASRLQLLNPAFYYKLDPFVRKEALKSLFTFAEVAGTTLGLAKLAGADVSVDPRNTDFAKIKVGNTRYDVLGGFQQYIVAASRLLSGQMVSSVTGKEYNLGEGYKPTTRLDILQSFFTNKTSPIASFAINLAKGQDGGGNKFDVPAEVMNRFLPMVAQDMYDLYRENGLPGLAMAFPGVFGVGIQTYGAQIPTKSTTATGNATIKWANRPGLGETIVNKIRGTKVEPVAVKAQYDQAQELVKQGKLDEARAIVDGLSDEDYELYKKFKQKDKAVAADEMLAKMKDPYEEIKSLKESGDIEEAQRRVDALTDAEYKAYKKLKDLDYKLIK